MAQSQPQLFHQVRARSIEGREFPLSELRGKVVLVVNTASECGFTPQYQGLQALHARLKSRGLVVLGVPCNQFGAQEPGTEKQIQDFCQTRFGVDFPLLAKADVKGPARHPLYDVLLAGTSDSSDVKWNFEKFLVGKDGKVLGRFGSKVAPEAPELAAAIEKALASGA